MTKEELKAEKAHKEKLRNERNVKIGGLLAEFDQSMSAVTDIALGLEKKGQEEVIQMMLVAMKSAMQHIITVGKAHEIDFQFYSLGVRYDDGPDGDTMFPPDRDAARDYWEPSMIC